MANYNNNNKSPFSGFPRKCFRYRGQTRPPFPRKGERACGIRVRHSGGGGGSFPSIFCSFSSFPFPSSNCVGLIFQTRGKGIPVHITNLSYKQASKPPPPPKKSSSRIQRGRVLLPSPPPPPSNSAYAPASQSTILYEISFLTLTQIQLLLSMIITIASGVPIQRQRKRLSDGTKTMIKTQ